MIRGQVLFESASAPLTIELVRADETALMNDFEPIVSHAQIDKKIREVVRNRVAVLFKLYVVVAAYLT